MVKICVGPDTCLDVNDPTTITYSDGVNNLKDFTSTRLSWTSMMGDVIPINLGSSIGFGRKMPSADYSVTTVWFPGTGTAYNYQMVFARFQDLNNSYYGQYYYDPSTSTRNLRIIKIVAGTATVLASASVTYNQVTVVMFEVEGSTLNLYAGYPLSPLTLITTASDTTFTDPGYAVARHLGAGANGLIGIWFRTDPPSSPVPEPKQYYLVPVVGKGTSDDPYRPHVKPVLSEPKTRIIDTNAYKLINSIKSLTDSDKELLMRALGVIADEVHDLSGLVYSAVMPVDAGGELFADEAVVGVLRVNEKYVDKVFKEAKRIKKARAEHIINRYQKKQGRKK